MYYWSISKAAKFAKEQTTKAASVKAWRITTKAGRALQDIARQIALGKGYEIATDAEIFAKYGELCPIFKVSTIRDNKPRIWCIYTNVANYRGRVSLSVVCVR
jgi:hypothetical protein